MYIYMGMFFNSPQDVPDFGSIKMYFVGTKDLGYVEEGRKKFRKYAFQSADISKLSLITNAIDGSEALAVDTGTTYVLYDGQWKVKSVSSSSAKEEAIEGITSIDYQVVQSLPNSGNKGIIYLIGNNGEPSNVFDEYIWTGGAFEKIGTTETDLTNYVQYGEGQHGAGKYAKFDSNGNLIEGKDDAAIPTFDPTTKALTLGSETYATGILTGDGAPWSIYPEPNYADGTLYYDLTNNNLYLMKKNPDGSKSWLVITDQFEILTELGFGDNLNNIKTTTTSSRIKSKLYFADATKTKVNAISNVPDKTIKQSFILEVLPGDKNGYDTFQRVTYVTGEVYERRIIKDNPSSSSSTYTAQAWKKIHPIVLENATQSTAGLMSASDKTKVDSIPNDAVYTDTTYENATTSVAGLLSPSDKIQLNNLSTNLNNKIDVSLKGAPNGVASLDSTGKIPSTQLPSYVDDVILGYYFKEPRVYGNPPQDFFYDENHTLITGESGKIYIDINTNKTYRYIGSNNNSSYNYTEISESLALGTTNSSAFYGDQGLAAYRHSNNINQSTGVAESIVDGEDAAALYKMKIYNNSGHIQTSSVSKATSSDITTLLGYTPINSNTKNVANGVAGLDSNSKISSSQLPGAILLENNTDLDTILTEGNYYASPSITVTNAPENLTYFNLQVVRTSSNAWNQILTVSAKMYTRAWIKAINETPAHWTEWKEIISDTKVTQNTTPASGTFDLLMAKTASNHTAETDTINKSNTLNYNTGTKELYINSNRALTVADIIICTQSEYDALQTKTGLIYLIKEQ